MQTYTWKRGDFTVTTDPSGIDLKKAAALIARQDWCCKDRPLELTVKAIQNSETFFCLAWRKSRGRWLCPPHYRLCYRRLCDGCEYCSWNTKGCGLSNLSFPALGTSGFLKLTACSSARRTPMASMPNTTSSPWPIPKNLWNDLPPMTKPMRILKKTKTHSKCLVPRP